MKKLRNIVLCMAIIALITTIYGCNVDADTSADTSAVLSGGTVKLSNGVLEVPVLIANNPGLKGYNITVTYDTDIIQPIYAENNEIFVGNFKHQCTDDGIENVIWSGTQENSYNGELFKIKFKVKDLSAPVTYIGLKCVPEDTYNGNNQRVLIEGKKIFVDFDELLGRETTKSEETTKQIKTSNNVNVDKASIKEIVSKKKSLKVSWKKVKEVNGYKIQYSLKNNFKKAKTKTVKKASKTSLYIKNLKSKKKYYVRIRTYKIVGGKTYYSTWSKAKSKKTK